jgi:hypothetical protein
VNPDAQRRMESILLAAVIASADSAEAISLLVGALTLACGRTQHPAACMSVAIESLENARAICVAHMQEEVMS